MYQQINPQIQPHYYPQQPNHNYPQLQTAQHPQQGYQSIEMQTTAPMQLQQQFVPQNAQLLQQGQQIIQGAQNPVYVVHPQPVYYFPIIKQLNEVIGNFSVSTMVNISCYLAASAILITYIVACSLGHQEWFPCMITSAGTDYPENIFFRIGLLTNIFYWLIMLVFEYWWLKAQSEALIGVINVSKKMNVFAFVGFFFYGLTIATIDDGHIPTQFHGACAVIFFIFLCVYIQLNFNTCKQIRKLNPAFMSNSSYNRKKLFANAWYVVFFFIVLLALQQKWALAVAEWIGTYSIIFYLQTFANDLKGFTVSVDDQQFKTQDLRVELARNLEEKQLKQQDPSSQNIVLKASNPSIQKIVPQLVEGNKNYHIQQLPTVQLSNRQQQNINQTPLQNFTQPYLQNHRLHNQIHTQPHFHSARLNPVNVSDSISTADNSFMSIKKPFISINGQN
ncbi:hypothetical protein ABPG72_018059 [Tetrahymena utriculariae]